MASSVVCISHTSGSGAQEICRRVAERLDFRYVDDEIIVYAAAADHAYPEAFALAESPDAKRQIEVDFNRYESTETVRELIREAIERTADEGKVVIVAHAASYCLAEREDVLRVLVTASLDTRLRRLADGTEHDARSAPKHLKEADHARQTYLKRFYNVSEELPTHYDLVVNTDKMDCDAAAEAIVNAASAAAGAAPPAAS